MFWDREVYIMRCNLSKLSVSRPAATVCLPACQPTSQAHSLPAYLAAHLPVRTASSSSSPSSCSFDGPVCSSTLSSPAPFFAAAAAAALRLNKFIEPHKLGEGCLRHLSRCTTDGQVSHPSLAQQRMFPCHPAKPSSMIDAFGDGQQLFVVYLSNGTR